MEEINIKIKNKLEEYFPYIKLFDLEGQCFIIGGFIINILLDEKINDLDLVVLNGNISNIIKNVERNNLKYYFNKFGGVRIVIDEKEIDIWPVTKLTDAYQYNIEGLFFDINNSQFIDITFTETLEKERLEVVNSSNQNKNYKTRYLKLYARLEKLLELKRNDNLPPKIKKLT